MRIAGIGPVVSALLGGGFFAAGALAAAVDGGPLLLSALSWLAVINVVLAVFNLIPAAPLDGGRREWAVLEPIIEPYRLQTDTDGARAR